MHPKMVAKGQKMKKISKFNIFSHTGTGFGSKIAQKLRKKLVVLMLSFTP